MTVPSCTTRPLAISIDHARCTRPEQDHVAVARRHDVRHADRAGNARVLVKVQRLAMRGNGDLRTQPAVKALDLAASGMAGAMHEMRAVGDDLDPLQDEAVDHPVHLALVAGDGARGEDDAIAGGETDHGVLAFGDAAHRGTGLALAARRKHDNAVTRRASDSARARRNRRCHRDNRSRARLRSCAPSPDRR